MKLEICCQRTSSYSCYKIIEVPDCDPATVTNSDGKLDITKFSDEFGDAVDNFVRAELDNDWEWEDDSFEMSFTRLEPDGLPEYVFEADPDPAEGFTYSKVEKEVSE